MVNQFNYREECCWMIRDSINQLNCLTYFCNKKLIQIPIQFNVHTTQPNPKKLALYVKQYLIPALFIVEIYVPVRRCFPPSSRFKISLSFLSNLHLCSFLKLPLAINADEGAPSDRRALLMAAFANLDHRFSAKTQQTIRRETKVSYVRCLSDAVNNVGFFPISAHGLSTLQILTLIRRFLSRMATRFPIRPYLLQRFSWRSRTRGLLIDAPGQRSSVKKIYRSIKSSCASWNRRHSPVMDIPFDRGKILEFEIDLK